MSKGNIYHEMKNGMAVSIATTKAYPLFDTPKGAPLVVAGLAAATTWIPGFFDTLPNGVAAGGLVFDVENGTARINTASAASPVFAVIS